MKHPLYFEYPQAPPGHDLEVRSPDTTWFEHYMGVLVGECACGKDTDSPQMFYAETVRDKELATLMIVGGWEEHLEKMGYEL